MDSLLEKHNQREARKWLAKKTGDQTARSLGRFKREKDAAKFVEALYQAGAVEVIAPDIYRNKARDQFADCLLVQLPKNAAKRKAVRQRLRATADTPTRRGAAGRGYWRESSVSFARLIQRTARQSRESSTASAPQAGRASSRHSLTASPTSFSTASRMGRAPSFG